MSVEIPKGRTPPDCVYFFVFHIALDNIARQGEARQYLLHTGNVTGNVLDGDGVFNSEPVRLTLYSRLVNEDPGIGC